MRARARARPEITTPRPRVPAAAGMSGCCSSQTAKICSCPWTRLRRATSLRSQSVRTQSYPPTRPRRPNPRLACCPVVYNPSSQRLEESASGEMEGHVPANTTSIPPFRHLYAKYDRDPAQQRVGRAPAPARPRCPGRPPPPCPHSCTCATPRTASSAPSTASSWCSRSSAPRIRALRPATSGPRARASTRSACFSREPLWCAPLPQPCARASPRLTPPSRAFSHSTSRRRAPSCAGGGCAGPRRRGSSP